MIDAGQDELSSHLVKDTKSIKKVDSVQLAEALKPKKTKYRIEQGVRNENYQREVLAPPIEDSRIVLQSTYSVAGGESGKRFIESSGAGPCVIATLYDASTKTGTMVHLDSRSNVITAVKNMKNKLASESSDYQFRIVGGLETNDSSRRIVEELRNSASAFNFPIVEEDILENGSVRKSVSVVLDSDTGKLYDLPADENSRFSQEQREKMGETIRTIATDQMVALGQVKFIEDVV